VSELIGAGVAQAVTVADAVLPSTDAVMVAVPGRRANTPPLPPTGIESSSLVQVTAGAGPAIGTPSASESTTKK
jgi:hypothetical protein